MRILNPAVKLCINEGELISLDIGCGPKPISKCFGVDRMLFPNLDIQADLNQPLDDLPDSCVQKIFSYHTLEHVENVVGLIEEFYRILCPGGTLDVYVPHFSNPYYYSDITHRQPFGLYSMYYFVDEKDQPSRKVPTFYSDARFRVLDIHVTLLDRKWIDRLAFPLMETVINSSRVWQDRYERRLCRIWPAENIRYLMTCVK